MPSSPQFPHPNTQSIVTLSVSLGYQVAATALMIDLTHISPTSSPGEEGGTKLFASLSAALADFLCSS